MGKIDLTFLGYDLLAVLFLGITIVIVVNRAVWLPFVHRVVSSISGGWHASLERARQQKAMRDRLYGYADMSSYGTVPERARTGFYGGSEQNEDAVLADTNQAFPFQFAEIQDFLSSHNLTDEQAITILALMRRTNGETYLSANKIRDIVGGADKDVKDQVAGLRPRPPQPKGGLPLKRPANGWN